MVENTGNDGAGNGNPAILPNGGGDDGNTPPPVDLFADLDGDTRAWITKRHADDPVALAKQAYELDRFAGNAVQVPKDDATPEERAKFYERLGRPAEPTAYELAPPEDLPSDVPYDKAAADWFRGVAFENGLSQAQARQLHDAFVKYSVDAFASGTDAVQESVQAIVARSDAELTAAWGPKDDTAFGENLELAGRAMRSIDPDGKLADDLKAVGLLGPNREVLVPSLAVALAQMGRSLFSEQATHGQGGTGGENPFTTGNLTQIMALVKADRDKARQMAAAAGKNPAEYGFA